MHRVTVLMLLLSLDDSVLHLLSTICRAIASYWLVHLFGSETTLHLSYQQELRDLFV